MLIAVEGNMGAGKTTLIGKLARELGGRVLPEPITSRTFATLLARYYAGPTRWGMTFQLDTLRARVMAQRCAPPGLVFQDRTVIGDQLFAKVAHTMGYIDETEFEVYLKLRDALMAELSEPVLILYLRARPEVCLERIGHRARGCEHGVSVEYLRALHEAHEDMAAEQQERCLIVPWDEFGDARALAEQVRERLSHIPAEPLPTARLLVHDALATVQPVPGSPVRRARSLSA